jgi:hypothetical protein
MKKHYRSKDCSTRDLPHDRLQAFWDIFKLRHDLLIDAGVLLFVFALPFAIFSYVFASVFTSIYSSYLAGEIDYAAYVNEAFIGTLYRDLSFLPCLALLALPLAGLLRIDKKLAFQEGIQGWGDLFRGIKSNYGQLFLLFILSWLGFFVGDLVRASGNSSMAAWEQVVRYIPLFLWFFLWVPGALLALAMIPLYEGKLMQKIHHGFFLYVHFWWQGLVVALSLALAFVPFFFGSLYVSLAFYLFDTLFYFPLFFLANQLWSNHVFDASINPESFPELVDKGLWR